MATAQLGSIKFNDVLGTLPMLPRAATSLHTRAGTAGVGVRVQPASGVETDVTFVAITTSANWLSTQKSYRALIGTVVAFTFSGVSWTTAYSVNFLVLGVEITEAKPLVRAVGIDPDGAEFDYTPAGRIVSRWRLVAVPSS